MAYNTASNTYGDKAYEHAKPTDTDNQENWLREGVQDSRTSEYTERYEKFKKQHKLQEVSELNHVDDTYTVETGDTMYPILTDYFGMNDHTAFLVFVKLSQAGINIDNLKAGQTITLNADGKVTFENTEIDLGVPSPATAVEPEPEGPTRRAAAPVRPAGPPAAPPPAPSSRDFDEDYSWINAEAAKPAPGPPPAPPRTGPPPPPSAPPPAPTPPDDWEATGRPMPPAPSEAPTFDFTKFEIHIETIGSTTIKPGEEFTIKLNPEPPTEDYYFAHITMYNGPPQGRYSVTRSTEPGTRIISTNPETPPGQYSVTFWVKDIDSETNVSREQKIDFTVVAPETTPPGTPREQRDANIYRVKDEDKMPDDVAWKIYRLFNGPNKGFVDQLVYMPSSPTQIGYQTQYEPKKIYPLTSYDTWQRFRIEGKVTIGVQTENWTVFYNGGTGNIPTTSEETDQRIQKAIQTATEKLTPGGTPPVPDAREAPTPPEAPALNEFEKINDQLKAEIIEGDVGNLHPDDTFKVRLLPKPNLPNDQWNMFFGTKSGEPYSNSLLQATLDQEKGIVTLRILDTAPAGTYHLFTRYSHPTDNTQITKWANSIEFTIVGPPPAPPASSGPSGAEAGAEWLPYRGTSPESTEALAKAKRAALGLEFSDNDSKGRYQIIENSPPSLTELLIKYHPNYGDEEIFGTVIISDDGGNAIYEISTPESGTLREKFTTTAALKQGILEHLLLAPAPPPPTPGPDEEPEAPKGPDAFEQAKLAALALNFRDTKGSYTILERSNTGPNDLAIYYTSDNGSAAKFIGSILIQDADATDGAFAYDMYRPEGGSPAKRVNDVTALKQAILEIFSKDAPAPTPEAPDIPDTFEQAKRAALALYFGDGKGVYRITESPPDSNEFTIMYRLYGKDDKAIGSITIHDADVTGTTFVYDIYKAGSPNPAKSRLANAEALRQGILDIFNKDAPTPTSGPRSDRETAGENSTFSFNKMKVELPSPNETLVKLPIKNAKFTNFRLSSPSRVVIDIADPTNSLKTEGIDTWKSSSPQTTHVPEIRYSNHGEGEGHILRFIVEYAKGFEYKITQEDDYLVVRVTKLPQTW